MITYIVQKCMNSPGRIGRRQHKQLPFGDDIYPPFVVSHGGWFMAGLTMNCGLLWGNRQDCIKVSCFNPKTGIRKKHQLKLGLRENKATLKVFQINCGLVLFSAGWNKSTMYIKGSNKKIHRLEEVLFERFELFRVMCCFASRVRSPAFAHVFSLELCIQLITIFAMK